MSGIWRVRVFVGQTGGNIPPMVFVLSQYTIMVGVIVRMGERDAIGVGELSRPASTALNSMTYGSLVSHDLLITYGVLILTFQYNMPAILPAIHMPPPAEKSGLTNSVPIIG